ncbi:uncharacterized protein FRV6_10275 [Fusarium oxysporum]|uniref:Uncharacterized protein n=1 Tax=Fusarium oxysporum TaxID=5507 RepID=A0A2H3TBL6_FUSOX|nr:uncharacterized protein FRV6_10275 [Fusarium oxysporum]
MQPVENTEHMFRTQAVPGRRENVCPT